MLNVVIILFLPTPTGKPIGPKSRAPTRCEPPTVRDGRSCGTADWRRWATGGSAPQRCG